MLEKILCKNSFDKDDLLYLINLSSKSDLDKLYQKAYDIKQKYIGKKAYYRGLIELSNVCSKDCYYCGIRKSNKSVKRFFMSKQEIVEMALWAYENEYGSITLQSGERFDKNFVCFIQDIIQTISTLTNNNLGITLCLGEQTYDTYKSWFDAGAHRYLLRIETTNKNLYESLHPKNCLHDFDTRVECLKNLKSIGYQVGTGVMIGLHDQTNEDLINDILFFEKYDIDMIGMGPYIVSKNTPLGDFMLSKNLNTKQAKENRFLLGLKMIALCRIYLKDINIAATTALQALNPLGRELGLKAGANILMPIITIPKYRSDYQLYDDKPCIDDTPSQCKVCLHKRVLSVGDTVGFGERGDSPHFFAKLP